jgi:hypothetical protein
MRKRKELGFIKKKMNFRYQPFLNGIKIRNYMSLKACRKRGNILFLIEKKNT